MQAKVKSKKAKTRDIEIGHIVQTIKQSYPISWGEVIYIGTSCKFYTVIKSYGTKVFTSHWKKEDLIILPKFDKFYLTSRKKSRFI